MAAEADIRRSTLPRGQLVEGGAEVYRHGLLAGLAGGAMLAAWFLLLDWARGHPFFTPTVLATALFRDTKALEHLETLTPSLALTLLFTVVHLTAFVIMGIAASTLVAMIGRRVNRLLGILLLFVVIQVGFVAFAMTFAAVALDALDWPDVLLGNLVAAAMMVTYLFRYHPRYRTET